MADHDHLQRELADRYRMEREIGRGGMAVVYLAEDLRHRRQVAIKVLAPEVASTIGPDRFLREIEIAARLSHPHILPLHESGEAAGQLFYVMPFVEGESLRDRLAREVQLPIEESIQYGREIAGALAYAHEQGVIHRDIKPENILIHRGHAVLADFGIARALSEAGSNRLTGTGTMIGTPAYMSPEQIAGESRLGPRADLYSLGCVLYEMLAGQPPFVGPTAESVVHQHLAIEAPSVAGLRATVPEPLARVVARTLAKAPVGDRYASAAELDKALSVATDPTAVHAPLGAKRGIPKPVLAAAGAVLVAALAFAAWKLLPVGARVDSLAVLPLANLSRDPAQEYFADGMTEELINNLGRVGALRVISRNSAMTFKGTNKTLPAIARELRVDALVEGSVLRVGDAVRISAELIQARPEQHLWGNRYERPLRDILALQSEVASNIAQEIHVQLTPQEKARLAKSRPVNPVAHEAYLKGRYHLNKIDGSGFRAAVESFQAAIAADPNDAKAWAGLSEAYYLLSNMYLPPPEAMAKAKAAARKAIELDAELSSAHVSLALVLAQYEWDWAAAEREYRRAIELDPNNAQGHTYYGLMLISRRRHDESLRELGRAQSLDPLSAVIAGYKLYALYCGGRFDEALEGYRALMLADTSYATWHYSLGLCYEAKGQMDAAIVEYRRAVLHADAPFGKALLAHGLALKGHQAEARDLLAQLEQSKREQYVSSYFFALVHVGMGEKERAFEFLERAIQNHDEELAWMNTDPKMDPLRSDPRFGALLKRLNLDG